MICILQGDITSYKGDAIVNAGNESLLGCFNPGHNCLDHQIHEKAGPDLTKECKAVMTSKKMTTALPGEYIMTKGYKLPCKAIIHAYGPNMFLEGFKRDPLKGAECLHQTYKNCLDMARQGGIRSLAFPAISTGLYGFDPDQAAVIALQSVAKWLRDTGYPMHVSFVMFPDNYNLYIKISQKSLR
jgi:O-acetyl-ADP-ribose deacetylase (regulator of RNase III)